MGSIEATVWCDGCGVEITWGPWVVEKRRYCCQDCAQGLACRCAERMEQENERSNRSSDTPSIIAATLYSG
jgi:hypothetical protein